MQFDQSIRELRQARNLSQRELAGWVVVTFTYIRKIKNDKIEFGDYPSEALISKLAAHPTAVGSSSFPRRSLPSAGDPAGDDRYLLFRQWEPEPLAARLTA